MSSRREELGERVDLLARERDRLQKLTAASDQTHAEHMAHGGAELQDLDEQLAAARERVRNAWAAVEQDKQRAERQRDYRVREIELQLAEYDALLNAKKDLLDVRAPWDGFVGFREPSPATAGIGNRPLLVLYKPGSIAVKVPVPTGRAELAQTGSIDIEMQALTPEAANSTFAGKVTQSVELPDGSGEVQIVGDPPEAAIRELATGSAVPVHVVIRRMNPLAAAKIGWLWWLAAACALGFAVSELRLRRARAHARAVAAGTATAKHTSSVLDWGGNPDEFLEYVVGVGIVPRKLRRAASVEVAEERRAPVPTGDRRRQQG
jgi:hypothetical protein